MLKLELELLSPALVGSGGGFGSIIDTDVVFDQVGLPIIPGKRLKGCLLDAATEVKEMFEHAQITAESIDFEKTLPKVFGTIGSRQSGAIYFPDLTLQEYEQNRLWLDYYSNADGYTHLVGSEAILETFTEIRQQTRIDPDGTAADHSLRTIRVLRTGLAFSGNIDIDAGENEIIQVLQLACQNLRKFGTQRNRGYGAVHCSLQDEAGSLASVKTLLESLCTK